MNKEELKSSAVESKKQSSAEPTVTMIFPKDLIVNPDGNHVHFKAGPNEVPLSLVDNWYLKVNGVKKYEPTPVHTPPPAVEPVKVAPEPPTPALVAPEPKAEPTPDAQKPPEKPSTK